MSRPNKPYRATSLKGAEREVRALRKRILDTELMEKFHEHRKLMAMLAADGPCFYNPLVAMEAKKLRDEILKRLVQAQSRRLADRVSASK